MKYSIAALPAVLLMSCVSQVCSQSVGGSTVQEDVALSSFNRLVAGKSTSATLKALDDALVTSPNNRLLRLRRANLLLDIGRAADAAKDLKALPANWSEVPNLRQARILLAHITGETQDELAIYDEWSKIKPESDPNRALSTQLDPQVYQAHIYELKGKVDDADTTWKAYLSGSQNRGVTYYRSYGDFLLRVGRYSASVNAYQYLLEHISPGFLDEYLAVAGISQAAALWADGRAQEAEGRISAILAKSRKRQSESHDASESLSSATVIAYALTRLDAPPSERDQVIQDRTNAEAALKSLAADLNADELFRYDIAVAAIAGKLKPAEAEERLSKILRESPYLEWALWSELTLAFAYPADAEHILKDLRENTAQYRILANHLQGPPKNPASQTSTNR